MRRTDVWEPHQIKQSIFPLSKNVLWYFNYLCERQEDWFVSENITIITYLSLPITVTEIINARLFLVNNFVSWIYVNWWRGSEIPELKSFFKGLSFYDVSTSRNTFKDLYDKVHRLFSPTLVYRLVNSQSMCIY